MREQCCSRWVVVCCCVLLPITAVVGCGQSAPPSEAKSAPIPQPPPPIAVSPVDLAVAPASFEPAAVPPLEPAAAPPVDVEVDRFVLKKDGTEVGKVGEVSIVRQWQGNASSATVELVAEVTLKAPPKDLKVLVEATSTGNFKETSAAVSPGTDNVATIPLTLTIPREFRGDDAITLRLKTTDELLAKIAPESTRTLEITNDAVVTGFELRLNDNTPVQQLFDKFVVPEALGPTLVLNAEVTLDMVPAGVGVEVVATRQGKELGTFTPSESTSTTSTIEMTFEQAADSPPITLTVRSPTDASTALDRPGAIVPEAFTLRILPGRTIAVPVLAAIVETIDTEVYVDGIDPDKPTPLHTLPFDVEVETDLAGRRVAVLGAGDAVLATATDDGMANTNPIAANTQADQDKTAKTLRISVPKTGAAGPQAVPIRVQDTWTGGTSTQRALVIAPADGCRPDR